MATPSLNLCFPSNIKQAMAFPLIVLTHTLVIVQQLEMWSIPCPLYHKSLRQPGLSRGYVDGGQKNEQSNIYAETGNEDPNWCEWNFHFFFFRYEISLSPPLSWKVPDFTVLFCHLVRANPGISFASSYWIVVTFHLAYSYSLCHKISDQKLSGIS